MTQQPDQSHGSIRLLIVEDDPILRDFLVEIFEGQGARIFTADCGAAALEQLKLNSPQMVLTNQNMPDMDGATLTFRLKEINPDIRIVMMTTGVDKNIMAEALRAEVAGFIEIPVDIDETREYLSAHFQEIRKSLGSRRLTQSQAHMQLKFSIPTNPAEIPAVLAAVGRMVEHVCPPQDWPPYETGLLELIQNAIEHGNLEIDFNQKSAALLGNRFESLLAERMHTDLFASRVVTIECSLDGSRFDCSISDQGNGFDWRRIMQTIDRGNLERLNGRGLLIVKHNFDIVEYNEKGNRVRVVKDFEGRAKLDTRK